MINKRQKKGTVPFFRDCPSFFESKYVSRGGIKLEKALEVFNINVKDKIVLDMGAGIGGFTDCLLQKEAKKIYAVDVGYGQLSWKLQQNPKVIRMDRINARYLKKEDFPHEIGFDIITIDVSFISLDKILPVAKKLLKENGNIIALVKPQFEVDRGKVGAKGVVRKPELHIEVLVKLLYLSKDLGLKVDGLIYSPIKGAEGNIEYFLNLTYDGDSIDKNKINEAVTSAWQNLK